MREEPTWNARTTSLTKEYLHCSDCRVDHPAVLFSAAQRYQPSWVRTCIGHEGYVRLCTHSVLRWSDVISTGSALATLDNPMEAKAILRVCREQAHVPDHHGACSPQVLGQTIHPTSIATGSKFHATVVSLPWTTYIRLPEHGPNKQITSEVIRRLLEKIRLGVAQFIDPELPPGRLPEMSCFDPNRCCCLRFPRSEEVPRGWQLASLGEPYDQSCRNNPKCRLGPLLPLGDEYMKSTGEARTQSHYASKILCPWRLGRNEIEVGFESCLGGSRCLLATYVRCITIARQGDNSRRVTPGWYQALDPDSYNLTADKESLGIFWCNQRGCRNYYRYVRKPCVPSGEYHRFCLGSCPGVAPEYLEEDPELECCILC